MVSVRPKAAGERADVTRTESASFSLRQATTVQATSAAPPPDDLRHRLAISALFGVDNSFSGNMIKAATGTTTGGVPINLNETTYDDVYGRMELFRLGVGYRETPRNESVFNFIYSRSSSQVVNVGTVGTTPLNVSFSDYSYWGVEGGQRIYFARTRFTPYVGLLLGLNRNGDIRGTFVNVPLDQTPGLAAQDGKFFEKSWSLSLAQLRGTSSALAPSSWWPRRSCAGRTVCRMSIGSSRRACATSTARARGGRSRSRPA